MIKASKSGVSILYINIEISVDLVIIKWKSYTKIFDVRNWFEQVIIDRINTFCRRSRPIETHRVASRNMKPNPPGK